MENTFWQQLPKPIIGLAPMDGVSDHPFRHIQKKYGQPAVMYTEFTSVEGLCHGANRLLKDFQYDESQRPIIGQIFGSTPKDFRQAAVVVCELGFDGVDINMGCPAKTVAEHGAGAALIQTPQLAQAIIAAVKAGVQDWVNGMSSRDCPDITPEIATAVERLHSQLPLSYQARRALPVSIKTRVGYHTPVINDWIPNLLEMQPAAIVLHGRTLKQQYGGQANWELIGQAAELVHQTDTLILGNGDVTSLVDAQQRISTYGLDGVLIGRGAMGHPDIFQTDPSHLPSRFAIAVEHSQLYEHTYQTADPRYHFMPMRKHLGWYVKEIPNASQVRIELFQTNSAAEVAAVLQRHNLV